MLQLVTSIIFVIFEEIYHYKHNENCKQLQFQKWLSDLAIFGQKARGEFQGELQPFILWHFGKEISKEVRGFLPQLKVQQTEI